MPDRPLSEITAEAAAWFDDVVGSEEERELADRILAALSGRPDGATVLTREEVQNLHGLLANFPDHGATVWAKRFAAALLCGRPGKETE